METIYRWFVSLFGSNLAAHLSGWDEATGDYTKANIFSLAGIIALIIAVALCVAYYYIINHPRFNRRWSWVTVAVAVAALNFGAGLGLTLSEVTKESDIAAISWVDCLGFGFANLIVALLFFTICSFAIKWWSRNCKLSPL